MGAVPSFDSVDDCELGLYRFESKGRVPVLSITRPLHPLFVVVELLFRDADLLFEDTGEQSLTNLASTLGNRRPTNRLAGFLFFVNFVPASGTDQHPSIPLQVPL